MPANILTIPASDSSGDDMAWFKLDFPVQRKSEPSWREQQPFARHVRTPAEMSRTMRQAQMSQMPSQQALALIPEAETRFTCFPSPSFSG
jgi:hypothetical protein